MLVLSSGISMLVLSSGISMLVLSSGLFVCLMVVNATFNNISVISCWSVLLVVETGVTEENHRHVIWCFNAWFVI
jgi:hypothetical protein